MGGAPKNTSTTTKAEPWDAAKPYYEDLYRRATTALDATNNQPYTGQLNAGPTADQTKALDLFRSVAGNITPPQWQTAVGAAPTNQLAMDTIQGKYLSPDSNPFIKAAVEASTRPVEQRLMRYILPQIEDQSIAQGAFGGAGNGTARALAVSDFTQQATDIGSRMYDANYQRERQNQMAAPSLFAQAQGLQDQMDASVMGRWNAGNQAALLPAQLLDLAGQQQQGWNQAALDAELQRYNINQAAPWAGLGELGQILNGGGFQSVGQTTRGPNTGAASFLQGAAGVAGIANSLGGGNWLANLFRGGGGASGGGTDWYSGLGWGS